MSGLFPRYLDRTSMLWVNTYAEAPIAEFLAVALTLFAMAGLVRVKRNL